MRSTLTNIYGLMAFAGLGLCPAAGVAMTGGTDIEPTDRPSVGIVTALLNGERRYGSGVIIESTISPASTWVLTAAHNLFDGSIASPRQSPAFIPRGNTGELMEATAIGHPDFVGGQDALGRSNDLALVRLKTAIAPTTIAPSTLNRQDPTPDTDSVFRLVAFGRPQDTSDFPKKMQKRQGDFKITKTNSPYEFESKQDSTVSGTGDSGGPYFFDKTSNSVVGIHRSGNSTDLSRGTYLLPYHGWIDSYTQRSIFWDNLRITGTSVNLKDGFADFFKGIAEPWERTAVKGPGKLGDIAVDTTSWRYMDSPVFDSSGDKHSQGEVLLGDKSSVIKRTFTDLPKDTELTIQIDHRWNSLGLGDGLGVQAGEGEIKWDALAVATEGTLDKFFTRTLTINTGDATSLSVYLLNAPAAAIPEPAASGLAAACLLMLARSRPRRRC